MTRTWVLVLASACIVASVTVAAATAKNSQSGKPIVLGASIALSGFEGPWDEVKMIRYALADINKRGGAAGRPLKLIVCDTKSDVALGAVCAKQVITKGAQIVISSCDFDFGGPAAVVAGNKGILTMSECASSLKFGPLGIGPLAFTMSQGSNSDAGAMAHFARTKLKARSAYILSDTFLQHKKEVCRTYLPDLWTKSWKGKLRGQDTYNNNDPSVGAQVARIKSLKPQPDVIFMCITLPGGPAVVRQIREAGITAPIITETGGDSPDYGKVVPNLSDYYYQTYGSEAGNDPNKKFNALSNRYLKDTGKRPFNSIIFQIYAMTEVLAQTVARTKGNTEGAVLQKALEGSWKGRPFSTILGPVRFDPATHHYVGNAGFGRYQNGVRTTLARFIPKFVPPAKLD